MIGLVIKVPKDGWKFGKGNPFRKKFWKNPYVYLLIPLRGSTYNPEGVIPCKAIGIEEDQLGVVYIEDVAGVEQRGVVSMDLKFVVDVAIKDAAGSTMRTTPERLIRAGSMSYYIEKLVKTDALQAIMAG